MFAVETRARMKSDVEHLSLIATVLVAAILLFAYRSLRTLVLGLLPVLSGVIAGIAGVSLAFGFVHGITLGFGITLIGEAVDYAIYLLTQTAPGAAPADTLPRIWPTLRLGMLTSVCGFSAMLLSSFTGFAQLGLFTIIGLVVALTVTRWVLPALMPRRFATVGSLVFAAPVLALIRAGATLRFVVLGLALAAAIALVFHRGPYWDDELESMSPLQAGEKSLDAQLRHEIGAPMSAISWWPGRRPRVRPGCQRASRHPPATADCQGVIAGFDAPALAAKRGDAARATGGIAGRGDAAGEPGPGDRRHAIPPGHFCPVPCRCCRGASATLAASRGPERQQSGTATRSRCWYAPTGTGWPCCRCVTSRTPRPSPGRSPGSMTSAWSSSTSKRNPTNYSQLTCMKR